jgi:hypothetical protein
LETLENAGKRDMGLVTHIAPIYTFEYRFNYSILQSFREYSRGKYCITDVT